MSHRKLIVLILFMITVSPEIQAQSDSIVSSLSQLPARYFSETEKKINKYSGRISSKTEKTLTKLVRWENKVRSLLRKASPETEQRLFANKEMTFEGVLEKFQQGKKISEDYTAQYNEYRDKLTTSLKYVCEQKELVDSSVIKPALHAYQKMDELNDDVARTEATEKFIRERKKQLINESIKYIGKSKYLSKINKESYYYVETLKNYKEIFSDPKNAEATAKNILNKIPAFQKFMEKNSLLAQLFGAPDNYGSVASLGGLQTRASVNSIIQERLSAGGPNAQDMMREQMQAAQAEMNKLKQKLLNNVPSNGEGDLPDFKPNTQRTKTFAQRLEYGFNLQFAKSNLLPSMADIGLSIGYAISDKSTIGIGASYKLGMGSIQHIKFSHEGVGLRSFADWKLKKNFFVSGGFEFNHNSSFKKIAQLRDPEAWQRSGLIGIMKKMPLRSKKIKNTQIQLLYDMLYRTHMPASQPVLFRVGYGF